MIVSNAFTDDPEGYLRNQGWHNLIGRVSTMACLFALPLFGEAIAVLVAFSYFIVIEWALQKLKLFWDSVEDSCHVAFGALSVSLMFHGQLGLAVISEVLWLFIVAIGYARRK